MFYGLNSRKQVVPYTRFRKNSPGTSDSVSLASAHCYLDPRTCTVVVTWPLWQEGPYGSDPEHVSAKDRLARNFPL